MYSFSIPASFFIVIIGGFIMIIPICLFIVGLVLLIVAGDWFVDGAVGIAHRFHMPEILIGATVVSIGTTLPEVLVSASGAVKGIGAMAYGNSLGSIICNTALIAAITIAVKPSVIDKKALKTPVIFFAIAAAIYIFVSYFTGTFSRISGIALLIIFLVYMIISVRSALNAKTDSSLVDSDDDGPKEYSLALDIILLVIGAGLIALGANLLVDNGTIIATAIGVPDAVIALTFVALGTSLPELVTAITSLAKGSGALSLGNIIGANMFNIVLVTGLSVTLAPFDVPCDRLINGINSSLIVDIPVMIFVSIVLIVPALIRGKMSRIQGILLLLTYAGFCAFQFLA